MSIIAKNILQALQAEGEYRAGATDVIDRYRHHISKGPIVDISLLPNLNAIKTVADGKRQLGSLVTIHQLATDAEMMAQYPGLTQTAGALANPQIRRAATLGGSLLQRTRCWYYRHEDISCYKKGGDACPARTGNHKYGVCFDLGPCVAPHPSTLGMAFLTYDAEFWLEGEYGLPMKELFGDGKNASADHTLKSGQLLTHIILPAPLPNEKAAYLRSISRARAEWPLVEVLVRGTMDGGGKMQNIRIGMGGVANIPFTLPKVEEYLNGKTASEEVFAQAGKIAQTGANPLPGSAYKVELVANTLIATLQKAFTPSAE